MGTHVNNILFAIHLNTGAQVIPSAVEDNQGEVFKLVRRWSKLLAQELTNQSRGEVALIVGFVDPIIAREGTGIKVFAHIVS